MSISLRINMYSKATMNNVITENQILKTQQPHGAMHPANSDFPRVSSINPYKFIIHWHFNTISDQIVLIFGRPPSFVFSIADCSKSTMLSTSRLNSSMELSD